MMDSDQFRCAGCGESRSWSEATIVEQRRGLRVRVFCGCCVLVKPVDKYLQALDPTLTMDTLLGAFKEDRR